MAHASEKRSQLTDAEIGALRGAERSYNIGGKTVRAIMSHAFGNFPSDVQRRLKAIFGDWVDEEERGD